MRDVVNGGEVTVNGRAAWRVGDSADDSSVTSVVTVTPATMVVQRARKTNCCRTRTCRLHCAASRSRTTLIILGLLAVGVVITVAVIGLTWTAKPLTGNTNGTTSEPVVLKTSVLLTFLLI